ncbi:anti-sigma factor [Aeromicrobium sp. Leaf350]|uniref:anti-sigma factor family protein n=1 Tax=Aeromicrobium sp. Leaf350 TaxID=2876565 RepID=UPI001E520E32|nr:hypothetical protein [Aeromicrobium sp. Leaf350]
MTNPSFTTLLDWVDGRLDEAAAASVRAHVDSTPSAAEAVEWIRSFREAGTSMPLESPPSEVRQNLRDAFRRHSTMPPGTGPVSELSGDPRPLRVASGARSADGEGVGHVVLEGSGVTLTLSVLHRRPELVDVHGLLTWDGSEPRPEIVLSSPDPTARRVARPEVDGEFRLTDVARATDEVWVVSPTASLHARLDLGSDT